MNSLINQFETIPFWGCLFYLNYETLKSLEPAFIALLGALVGGLCAIWGVNITHKNNIKEHEIKEKKEVNNYLKAIHAEVSTIWERYEKEYKSDLDALPEGKFIAYEFPIKQKYFTVYDNNTNLLGKIENVELMKEIVITYTQAKALMDSLLCNNEILTNYTRVCSVWSHERSSANEGVKLAFQKELLDYALKIKQQSIELEESVKKLFKGLNGYSS